MLKIIQRFGNTAVAILRKNMEWLGVLEALYRTDSSNPTFHLLPVLYEAAKTPNHSTSTLKMAIAMFAKIWIIFNIRRGHPRKLKIYTELQPRKPKDKNNKIP
jgi:hypothetical protein